MVEQYSSKDPLLMPLKLKHLHLRNRIMSTSHACGLEEDGLPKDRYQTYHEEKARGGIALSMFGGSSNIAVDSPSVFQQLYVGSDAIIPHLQKFSARMHAQGATLMCQITHLGRRGDPYADNWLPAIAPSIQRETLHRAIPKEMDEHDINRVIKAYGEAARRCQEGGLDGIETLASSHLIGQFLSPLTNNRSDRFGGSLENRCRFGLMVHEEIRRQTGDKFIVGMRYNVDEGPDGGLNFDQCVAAALIFQSSAGIDFINANFGKMDTLFKLTTDCMPSMESPIAPWLEVVGRFKKEVDLPIFHAARISDIATARYAIKNGLLDMVGMTRAHIADPHIVNKIARGEEERIRPCVGATHCMSNFRPACLHNASAGREKVLPHIVSPANTVKKVVVVGGGPAGLECARIAASRGHQVILFEATPKLGGQILVAVRNEWRKDLIGIIDWRVAELDNLGVTVELNSYVEAAEVLAESPDYVIIATGGLPNLDFLEGGEHCTSCWDLLTGYTPLVEVSIVYDGTGRHGAASSAEFLARNGKSVSLIALDGELCLEMTYAERSTFKKHFYELSIPTQFDQRLVRVERENEQIIAFFVNEATGVETQKRCGQLIVDRGTLPIDDLFHDLRDRSSNLGVTDLEAFIQGAQQKSTLNSQGAYELHRIGDAIASRNIHAAILDAARLANAL